MGNRGNHEIRVVDIEREGGGVKGGEFGHVIIIRQFELRACLLYAFLPRPVHNFWRFKNYLTFIITRQS